MVRIYVHTSDMISNILPKQYRDVDLVMVEALQLWLQKLCGQLNSTYTWVSRILRKWGGITGLKAEAEILLSTAVASSRTN